MNSEENQHQQISEPDSNPTFTNDRVVPQPKNHFKTAKAMLKMALIIGGIVLIWVVILLIISGGDFNEGTGRGAIWWLLMPATPFIYVVPILFIISLVHAILGVRDKKVTRKSTSPTITIDKAFCVHHLAAFWL